MNFTPELMPKVLFYFIAGAGVTLCTGLSKVQCGKNLNVLNSELLVEGVSVSVKSWWEYLE